MHNKLAFARALLAAPAITMAEAEDAISSDRPDFVDSRTVVGKGLTFGLSVRR